METEDDLHNIPQDTTVENLQRTIVAQNPELGLKSGILRPYLSSGKNGGK